MTKQIAVMINRVSQLTASGVAAIAVVRFTGPGVDAFLARRFSKPVLPGRCVHGLIQDDQRVIDDAVAVRSGEILDLNLHGGNWVVQSVLQLAQTDGFTLSDADATDGPTELWQQVLRALPLAKTPEAARMLLAQPKAWESPGDLQSIIDDPSGKWMLALPRVAIAGPANVGKSTLANQLFGQMRSITADLPGTTRDWVGEIANLDGLAVMLVDTPGIRATTDPIEDAAITSSAEQIRSADLVVLVLDQSQPLNQAIIHAYPTAIRVANKSDSESKWNATEIAAVQTVATTGIGIDKLRKEIRRRFACEPMDLSRARWWTENQRHDLVEKLQSKVV
jgi:small GTP-binding protein